FVPNKVYLRGILLHYFIQKKSAAEAHRILVQTYGDDALSDTTCRDWFRRFKNNDFQLEDKERSGAPKKCQDKELEQLLDTCFFSGAGNWMRPKLRRRCFRVCDPCGRTAAARLRIADSLAELPAS
ncbi:MOS1T transposase, partial [Pseudoatta argentina]